MRSCQEIAKKNDLSRDFDILSRISKKMAVFKIRLLELSTAYTKMANML
jgi:hypothetical protein